MSQPAEQVPPVPQEAKRQRARWVLLLLAAAALGLLAWVVYALGPGSKLLPRCVFHEVTGLHCPGCGMTRATHALFHGCFLEAIDSNPLLVITPIIALMVTWSCLAWAGLVKAPPQLGQRLMWTVAIVVIGFGVLRNLPWWPFTWLAP
jgi:hypothetical protein